MAKILGIGNVTLDIILTTTSYPKEDEELRAINRTFKAGGNVNNSLNILTQLGHQCDIVSTIANDESANKIIKELATKNINTDNLQKFIQGKTPTSYIILNKETGSRTITHFRDLPEVSFDFFAKIEVENYDWLHFEGRNIDSLKGMINIAKTFLTNQPISLEVEKKIAGIEEIIPLVNIVIFSHNYAKQNGYKNAPELLKKMCLTYPETILICTWGKQGAWYVDDQHKVQHQPAEIIPQTIDTNGAGDTFNAALIHNLLQNKSIAKSVIYASKLAAKKCQQLGLDNILTTTIKKQPIANIEQISNSKATIVPSKQLAASIILIKHESKVKAYLNNCPHQDIPLNEAYKIDVNPFTKTIKCSVHNAFFNIKDGNCVEGPCLDEELEPILIKINENGDIFLKND